MIRWIYKTINLNGKNFEEVDKLVKDGWECYKVINMDELCFWWFKKEYDLNDRKEWNAWIRKFK